MPPLLAELYQALPNANINTYIANTQEVVAEVEQLNIDIALVEGMPRPTDMKAIEQREWRTDALIVFAKRDSQWLKDKVAYNDRDNCYELSMEQLAHLPLLVREAGSGTRQIIDEQLLKYLPDAHIIMAIQQSAVRSHQAYGQCRYWAWLSIAVCHRTRAGGRHIGTSESSRNRSVADVVVGLA